MNGRLYFDHAATTVVRPEARAAMLAVLERGPLNPSSIHADGRAARALLDDARERVAAALRVRPKEIVFTGGGSEADTQALIGTAYALRDAYGGDHLITSAIEHHAVLHAVDALEADGFRVTRLPVTPEGVVDVAAFRAALVPATILASVMLANNEIGTIQPVAELAALARVPGVVFHTDAIQAAGQIPLDLPQLGADLVALSAHKFGGPAGVGILVVRGGVPLTPIVHGGGQERGRRAGTENVAGIVATAVALERAVAEQPAFAERVGALRDRLQARLTGELSEVRVNGEGAPRLPNNLSLGFAGIDAQALLIRLDLDGIAVSTGSACTSGTPEPSHVVAALGLEPEIAAGVVRFSLGRTTTPEEVERIADIVTRVVNEQRSTASIGV